MAKTPTTPRIKAEPYQMDLAEDLRGDLTHGQQALLIAPTGSGKTLIIRMAVAKLRPNFVRGVLVLAPQDQIKDGWVHPLDVDFPPEDTSLFAFLYRGQMALTDQDWQQRLARMRGGDERHFLQMWLRASTPAPFGYATTHHGFRRWAVLPGFLPDDLSGFLLVVDEFHHVSSSNHIGAAVREWLRRGGKVLYTTATPFRSDRDLPIPEDLVPAHENSDLIIPAGLPDPASSGSGPGACRIRRARG